MTTTNRASSADVMRKDVIVLSPSDTIERALELFEEQRIGGAPVVDALGKLVGVLTLSDVTRTERLADGRVGARDRSLALSEPTGEERLDELDPDEVFFLKEDYSPSVLGRDLVGDWMTRRVVSVRPDTPLERACRVMVEQHIHRVFVTEGDKLCGVISSFDVVRHAARSADEPIPRRATIGRRALGALAFAMLLAAGAHAQTTLRASVSSIGAQGNGSSDRASISAAGRFIAFSSTASNLVPDDTNGVGDVFVRDQRAGTTTRVSLGLGGVQGNGESWDPWLSADGRRIVFASRASNLVLADDNHKGDVFVRDLVSGETWNASVSSSGVQGNYESFYAVISSDGEVVAFESDATNLVPGDTNGRRDVFVHDLRSRQTTRASVGPFGVEGNGSSEYASISGDGRYVTFHSYASTLVTGDTNNFVDAFVHDVATGTTTRVSVDSAGMELAAQSVGAWISADGRWIAFHSDSTTLVPGDTNGAQDVFVRDMQTGQVVRASVDSSGQQGNDGSLFAVISADGAHVVFESFASNFVGTDTNGYGDLFVHDLATGQTARVSVGAAGADGNLWSFGPAISADGRHVAFSSEATNFVAGDTNDERDVFVHDRQGTYPFAAACFGDGSLPTPCPCSLPDSVPSPSAAAGHGCANSFDLAGALLAATGSVAPDTVVLVANVGVGYTGFAFLVKGDARSAIGFGNGDGVRCVDGTLIRFGGHSAGSNGAPVGSWIYPNSAQTMRVSIATAQSPSRSAWYQLVYRNSTAGFCSPGTTNWTNSIEVSWP